MLFSQARFADNGPSAPQSVHDDYWVAQTNRRGTIEPADQCGQSLLVFDAIGDDFGSERRSIGA